MTFCWIPPGDFIMGAPDGELGRSTGEAQHRVRITDGFWLADTPTTQAQWQGVMGHNPSWFQVHGGENHPVDRVSWFDICGNVQRDGGFLGRANEWKPVG